MLRGSTLIGQDAMVTCCNKGNSGWRSEKIIHHEDDQMQVQVPKRGCGISMLGDTWNLPGQGL